MQKTKQQIYYNLCKCEIKKRMTFTIPLSENKQSNSPFYLSPLKSLFNP